MNAHYDSNVNCTNFLNRFKNSTKESKNEETNTIMRDNDTDDKTTFDYISVFEPTKEGELSIKQPKTYSRIFAKKKSGSETKFDQSMHKHSSYKIRNTINTSKELSKGILINMAKFAIVVMDYTLIYGTELIVQVLAASTMLCIIILRYLESMLKNRHLANCISYMEGINVSKLRKFRPPLNYRSLFRGFVRFIWIIYKLIELGLVILKHMIIQFIMMLVFMVSWMAFFLFQIFTQLLLTPTVDKTMNMLRLDAKAVSELTTVEIKRLSVRITLLVYEVAPLVTDALALSSNLKNYISQVSQIRTIMRETIALIRDILQVIINSLFDTVRIMLTLRDIMSGILAIVIMIFTYSQMICDYLYFLFLTLRGLGNCTYLFIQSLNSFTSFIAKFQVQKTNTLH